VNQVYSTREMAQMCGVNESTIKRWADSGKLRCMKTPGGHRKFRIKDVLAFLSEYGFEAMGISAHTGSADTEDVLPVAILQHDVSSLSRHYLETALRGDSASASAFLMKLLTAGYPLGEICDGVLGPALHELGTAWSEGRVSLLEEHIASASTMSALSRLSDVLPRQVPTGKRALCCPAGREEHAIGVAMTSSMLEWLGWDTRAATSPTPASEIVNYLRREKPDLVCISVVNDLMDGGFLAELGNVYEVARETRTRMAIGGRGVQGMRDIPQDFMGQSLSDLESYARSLSGRRMPAVERTNVSPG
jgi:MerR family transcriptional regulator, light-induced transcriptional regulator